MHQRDPSTDLQAWSSSITGRVAALEYLMGLVLQSAGLQFYASSWFGNPSERLLDAVKERIDSGQIPAPESDAALEAMKDALDRIFSAAQQDQREFLRSCANE